MILIIKVLNPKKINSKEGSRIKVPQTYKSEYNSLSKKFRENESENKRLTEDNNKAQEEIQRLNSEIEEKDKTIKSLEEEIDSFKDPEKLLIAFVSVVQEDARFLAIEAAKELLEKERKNDSEKISGLTEIFNNRLSELNDRFNNLQALVQKKDIEEENYKPDPDPDFSEEDLAIMKNLSILLVQNADYKNNSQGQEKLLSCFSKDSESYTETRKVSQTRNVIENSVSGNRFDYIVIHLDRISHASTEGIPLYQDPRIIIIRRGQENPLTIKYSILERFKKNRIN